MPGKRATPESRKLQILAAADQVLIQIGIEHFTVDRVIEVAHIAKGTVYRYYKNKDEMLAELGVKALTLLQADFDRAVAQQTHSMDKVKAIVGACYQFYQHHLQYFELISYMERPEFDLNASGYLKLSEHTQRFTQHIIEQGQAKGEINPSLDATMLHYIMWAACVGVVEFVETKKKLLKHHHQINTEHMIGTFAELMTKGMAP